MTVTTLKCVILGAGGHQRVICEMIHLMRRYEILGVVDAAYEVGRLINDVPVLGNDDALSMIFDQGVRYAVIGVGQTKQSLIRQQLYEKCVRIGFELLRVIHPSAILSDTVSLGRGIQLMAGVILNPHTNLGENVVVNTGSSIDHDCCVGSHSFIGPGVTISGGVKIGNGVFIGAGTTIIQGVEIGDGAVIGAGSTVLSSIRAGALAVGTPCKELEKECRE